MLSKVFAVLSAAFLVGAVAAGTLAPPDMSLGEALAAIDHLSLATVETWVRGHLSMWLWDHPVRAVMDRPVWLLPAAAGLLCFGGSMTAASFAKAPNPPRRRRS